MYYLGRLTGRMSEVDIAAQVAQVPRPSTREEAVEIRRRCAAEIVTAAMFMAPIAKALAEAKK